MHPFIKNIIEVEEPEKVARRKLSMIGECIRL